MFVIAKDDETHPPAYVKLTKRSKAEMKHRKGICYFSKVAEKKCEMPNILEECQLHAQLYNHSPGPFLKLRRQTLQPRKQ